MDNIQLNKVKISVTELDSFILKSRKDLQAKINKNKFLRKQAKLAKERKKKRQPKKLNQLQVF